MARQQIDYSTMTDEQLAKRQKQLEAARARSKRYRESKQLQVAQQMVAAAMPAGGPTLQQITADTSVFDIASLNAANRLGAAAHEAFQREVGPIIGIDGEPSLGGGLYVGPQIPTGVPYRTVPPGVKAALDAYFANKNTYPVRAAVTAVRDRSVDDMVDDANGEAGVTTEMAQIAAAQELARKLATMTPGQQAVYLYEEEIDRKLALQGGFTGKHVNDFPFWQNWRGGKVKGNYSTSSGSGEDMFLKELYKHQGFDCLPILVTKAQMDLLIRYSAGKVLYRGVKATYSTTAAKFLTDFQSGEYYAGRGVNGPGTYCGGINDAKAYNGNGTGAIVKMLLSRRATVKATSDLRAERQQEQTDLIAKLQTKMNERIAGETERHRQRFVKRLYNDRMQAINDITSTDGYYAVWKQYDAISECGYSPDTRVVYNRGVLYVQKELV